MFKLDILAFAAHPDDVELSCSGTLIRHIEAGKRVGIVDLTKGELGSRGSADLRKAEAAAASQVMGIHYRANLGMRDGFFTIDEAHQRLIIQQIRHTRPDIVLANAVSDRHIDHGRAAKLVAESTFLSGLRRIETQFEGEFQEAWRPRVLYHYIQDRYIKPDFVVDITEQFERKLAAVRAFGSQFYDPNSQEPMTPISRPDFLDFIEARAREMGRLVPVTYGEGFTVERAIGVNDLSQLL
ncbi:MAG: bacillithiol biosynthesis deacetylase BshB1 [Sphingobacteriaceae bacterium]|nr:bacillithiol biosynthesis deacetylase BshB1 [Sphingobacteriaceae bacterium]